MVFFRALEKVVERPAPFTAYTADILWTDPHISRHMLATHLDKDVDLASRNHRTVAAAADWLIGKFQLETGKSVIDFGCGPGLYTTRFARTGATVHGVDFSASSIAYARDRARDAGLAITYHQDNYLSFSPPDPESFDLATLIFLDLCPLSPKQRNKILRTIADCLKPGGTVVLDVLSTVFLAGAKEQIVYSHHPGGGFWSAAPHHVFQCTIVYPDQELYLDKFTIVEKDRQREVFNWLQCFSPEQLTDEMAAVGLMVDERYRSVVGDAYDDQATEFAVVARKV